MMLRAFWGDSTIFHHHLRNSQPALNGRNEICQNLYCRNPTRWAPTSYEWSYNPYTSRAIIPVTHLFSAIYKGYKSMYFTIGDRAHLVWVCNQPTAIKKTPFNGWDAGSPKRWDRGCIFHPPRFGKDTYHLLGEPETTIERWFLKLPTVESDTEPAGF